MKKLLMVLLAVISLTSTFSGLIVSADETFTENVISEEISVLEDGSYVTIIVTEEPSVMTRETVYNKTGSKSYILRNKDGAELWRFTVHGTFSVNSGVSSTCTNVSHSISITEDAWQNESATTSLSGNQAIGDASFIKKLLFITVETKECHVVLACDKNGNLS